MKTQVTLLFLFLMITGFSQMEFAPIGAEWYYSETLSYNPPKYGYIKLTSLKDSTINNTNVRVIEVLHVENDTTHKLVGYEYIAQSGDTIWYWKNNDFHMLYDFSMQKGDSILLYSEMRNSCSEKNPYGWNLVDSTFSKEFNGLHLKAYSSVPIKNSVWGFDSYSCEIIGNLRYLIPQNVFCGVVDVPLDGPLRCYSDPVNGILITSLPSVKCDSTYAYKDPVNISMISKTKVLSIYPNPVYSELIISGNYQEIKSGNYDIEIVNINGEIVKNCSSFSETIDVSGLKSGIYFLIISKNKKQIDYEKFIKK